MHQSHAIAGDSTPFTADQIADLLAVQIWAEILLAECLETVTLDRALGVPGAVTWLDSLLASLRPVAAARAELARLDGGRLLDGFEVWAARQRVVMNGLASSSLGRE